MLVLLASHFFDEETLKGSFNTCRLEYHLMNKSSDEKTKSFVQTNSTLARSDKKVVDEMSLDEKSFDERSRDFQTRRETRVAFLMGDTLSATDGVGPRGPSVFPCLADS
jgi:hypothetical protein